jgi:hypothetical protein
MGFSNADCEQSGDDQSKPAPVELRWPGGWRLRSVHDVGKLTSGTRQRKV